jgi:hypothetical protein
MATGSDEELNRELLAVQAENEALRRTIADLTQSRSARGEAPGGRGVVRALLAVILITLGVLTAPLALVASWAATEVSDTDRFVASLAPLSQDPEVRAAISSAVVVAIDKRIDIDRYTADAFDGIASLASRPAVAAAVKALAPAAADGIRQLLSTSVRKLVDSAAFQKIWDRALRASHTQLEAILRDDRTTAVIVSDTGVVAIQLKPIIAQVKAQLTKANFPLAEKIPTVNATVKVATVENMAQVRTAYRLLVTSSALLPWIGLVLLAGGVLVARVRPRAVLGAGVGLVVIVTILLLALIVVRVAAVTAGSGRGIPRNVVFTLFDTLTTQVRAAGLALVLVGIVLAFIGFVTGRSRQALAIRSTSAVGLGRAHRFLDSKGISNPKLARALYQTRYALWTLVSVAVAAVLLLTRPLTTGSVALTALAVAVIAILFALFYRRTPEPLPPPEPESGVSR